MKGVHKVSPAAGHSCCYFLGTSGQRAKINMAFISGDILLHTVLFEKGKLLLLVIACFVFY